MLLASVSVKGQVQADVECKDICCYWGGCFISSLEWCRHSKAYTDYTMLLQTSFDQFLSTTYSHIRVWQRKMLESKLFFWFNLQVQVVHFLKKAFKFEWKAFWNTSLSFWKGKQHIYPDIPCSHGDLIWLNSVWDGPGIITPLWKEWCAGSQ